MHAKNQDGSPSKISRQKQMFCACFISGFRDFMRHLTSGILRARLFDRNLDSLRSRVHSCYVVCRLRVRAAKNPFEPPWMDAFPKLKKPIFGNLRVIRKTLRKNSEIFVSLRRSSGQSVHEWTDRWPLFLVLRGVPGCIEGIPGHYGMFRGVTGVFWGVPRVFRGGTGVFRVCSGFYRHPLCVITNGNCKLDHAL